MVTLKPDLRAITDQAINKWFKTNDSHKESFFYKSPQRFIGNQDSAQIAAFCWSKILKVIVEWPMGSRY